MKIIGNVIFIVFLVCLIISLFLYLSPTNTSEQWKTIGLSDLFYIIENAPTFDVSWVDTVIRVYDDDNEILADHEYGDDFMAGDYNLGVSLDIAKFLNNLFKDSNPTSYNNFVYFINTWLLAPLKVVFTIGTIGVDIFICIGYLFTTIF